MATKPAEFQKIVNNVDDDSTEDEELKENNYNDSIDDLDLNTMKSRYGSNITPSAQSPIDIKLKEHKNKQLSKISENSEVKFTLLENAQNVPAKLHYQFDGDVRNDPWDYHPRLGDVEKRKITVNIKSKNKKGSKINRKEETLWFAKEGSLRKVFISLKVKRVSAIDNIKETFRMRFHLYLNWIMTEEEYRKYLNESVGDYYYEPIWKPDLEFMNAVETHKKEFSKYPEFGIYKIESFNDFGIDKHEVVEEDEFDPTLCKFIRCKLECDITFAEELELQSFPFDVQDLSVIIKGISSCYFNINFIVFVLIL